MTDNKSKADDPFHVPAGLDFWAGMVCNHPRGWAKIGNFETALLKDDIKNIEIKEPVYIAGLARSGSTLLLEILASHKDVATHRYQDYPFLFTPWFWNTFLSFMPSKRMARERPHGDKITISGESPEAMEEILWMGFFENLHNPARPNTLSEKDSNPAFETFYKEHLQKLLYSRKKTRYVSKGNYNSTRIPYIHKLFPDARFVVPVRDPVTHIASLLRQHDRFCEGQEGNPRAQRSMAYSGHFEFGLGRVPVNAGDTETVRQIEAFWEKGDAMRGWAKYWASVYDHIRRIIDRDEGLKDRIKIMRFEDLCTDPDKLIRDMIEHCRLDVDEEMIAAWTARIKKPDYYQSGFSNGDISVIREETYETAGYFGYS